MSEIKWDGDDRRQMSADHDLLLELKGILLQQNAVMDGHQKMMENHIKTFDKHVNDDSTNFTSIWKMLGHLKWYVAMGTGIIVALEFAAKFYSSKG